MNFRDSCLPPGWYPRNPDEISVFLSGFAETGGSVSAAAAPHAGWFYSGKIAARAAAALNRKADTVVVIGGHLPKGYPPLFAMEDAVNTPLGGITIDAELREIMYKEIKGRADQYPDNTVEVLLPMVRFFMPKARLLWVRLPADMASFDSGKALADAAKNIGRNIAVLASTDLTHYGPNYGYTPKGCGQRALKWVKEVNDRNFIEAVESGDPAAALERAESDLSSCSAGAVLGAMGYASAINAGPARLLEYATSADAASAANIANAANTPTIPDSFVGYAAFQWGVEN
ncbi:MAG: AmmeMemoRadiSam system protein B [Treponema sp.]|jgi:AmmeMemoRadiSam system protein B|nr:AmmeMemoRadiSam system protein B [Treponema sp.]